MAPITLDPQVFERMEGSLKGIEDVLTRQGKTLQGILTGQRDALLDIQRQQSLKSVQGSTAANVQRGSNVAGVVQEAIGKGGPGGSLASLGVGLGSIGLGIGGFFMGLAGAEAIMDHFGSGDNLKKLLINLGDGIESFDAQSLLALGTLLAGSALFSKYTSLGGQFRVATGMTAIGAGIGGFFSGLMIADETGTFLSADLSNLKNQMINLGDGLEAFSGRDLAALGTFLSASALFSSFTGLGGQFRVATGMTAIGAGIGGFFSGLMIADETGKFLNTDLSNLKNQMTNVADGLAAFSGRDLAALGAVLGTGLFSSFAGLGTQVKMATGMTAIGAGIGGFFSGLALTSSISELLGIDGASVKNLMINLGEGLAAFGDRDLKFFAGLLGAGALFGQVPAIAGLAAVGLTAVGAGIGGFFSGIGLGDAVLQKLGADGSGVKTMMINLATGLQAFGAVDGEAVKEAAGGLFMLTPALTLFFGSRGISSILDSMTDFITWVSGGNDPIDTVVAALNKFALIDFTNFKAGDSSVGAVLKSISEGLMAFSESNFNSSVLDTLTSVINWFTNNKNPFEQIESIGQKADLIDKSADAIERMAEALNKFAAIKFDTSSFDFEKLAESLGNAVPLLDALLNGGDFDPVGLGNSFEIKRGLLSKDFNLDQAVDAIAKVKNALSAINMVPSNTAQSVPQVQQQAMDIVPSYGPAGGPAIVNAPTTKGGDTYNNTSTTNNYYGGPAKSLAPHFLPQ